MSKLNESAHNLSVSEAQELICQYFLKALQQSSPESVLQEFKHLFIEPSAAINSIRRQALDCIIASGFEQSFFYTLKRSIYILVNNWSSSRQQDYIQQLVQLLSIFPNAHKTCTATLKRLMAWRRIFVNSQDYQELKLFASKYENRHREHWSQRYNSYLLVSQAVDVRKPLEQQEAARTYSKQLKEQFKLELAMYTARSSSVTCQACTSPNPTSLGDDVLSLLQNILQKRDRFSYASLARIFLNQTQQLRYKDFKQKLLDYLLFSTQDQDLTETIKTQLAFQLNTLYEPYHNQPWDSHLLLRTCKRLIEYFTTVDCQNPSRLFILLIAQGKALNLAILLLKLVLLCPQTYTHLECCLAQLIHYYKSQSESECQWLIHFLEIIQLTLTIYAEDVRYNLVEMSEYKREIAVKNEEQAYRIFSQIKSKTKMHQQVA
ncbi:MAG TPA: hypothetical protein V6C91_19045 [Coleofasciculaceae cyanobacterium]